MKYEYKKFNDGGGLVEYLNSLRRDNHTAEGVWSCPDGVCALVVFWYPT